MPSEQAGMSPGLLQRLNYKEPVIDVCHQLVFTHFFFVSFSDSTMAALVHFKNTLRLSEKLKGSSKYLYGVVVIAVGQ